MGNQYPLLALVELVDKLMVVMIALKLVIVLNV
jgi:hypothetical protein